MTNRIEEVKKILQIVWDNAIGRMRLPPKTAVKEFNLEDYARQICQLFPQPLDDEELEKAIFSIVLPKVCRLRPEIDIKGAQQAQSATTEIRALLQPKIEEAKREERERIVEIYTRYRDVIAPVQLKKIMLEEQALKGGE